MIGEYVPTIEARRIVVAHQLGLIGDDHLGYYSSALRKLSEEDIGWILDQTTSGIQSAAKVIVDAMERGVTP